MSKTRPRWSPSCGKAAFTETKHEPPLPGAAGLFPDPVLGQAPPDWDEHGSERNAVGLTGRFEVEDLASQ